MKGQRFEEYSKSYIDMMSQDFISGILSTKLQESQDVPNSTWTDLHKKVIGDLSINSSVITTFGMGVAGFYPIVSNLINNMNLNASITPLLVVEMTICAISIIYLEDRKEKLSQTEKEKLTKDIQSDLEEFRMQGTYGVIKKLIKCFTSIKGIFNIICKHLGRVIYGFADMFAYTSLLIPIMSTIESLITKYKIDLDTLPGIFLGLGVGITTLISKNFIADLINQLKKKFGFKKKEEEKIKQELGVNDIADLTPTTIQKFSDLSNIETISEGDVKLEKHEDN